MQDHLRYNHQKAHYQLPHQRNYWDILHFQTHSLGYWRSDKALWQFFLIHHPVPRQTNGFSHFL